MRRSVRARQAIASSRSSGVGRISAALARDSRLSNRWPARPLRRLARALSRYDCQSLLDRLEFGAPGLVALAAQRDRRPEGRRWRRPAGGERPTVRRAARAGFRRHQRQARFAAPTGRAWIGSPAPKPPQVVGQRLGAGVALGRLLLQALQADRLQVARQARAGAAPARTGSAD